MIRSASPTEVPHEQGALFDSVSPKLLTSKDVRTVRRVAINVAALVAGFFAIRSILGDTVTLVSGSRGISGLPIVEPDQLIFRAVTDIITASTIVAFVWLTGPERRSTPVKVLLILVGGIIAATVKVGLRLLYGHAQVDTSSGVAGVFVEALTVFVAGSLVITAGVIISRLWRRTLIAERARLDEQERVVTLLRSVQATEFRMRKRLSVSVRTAVERLFVALEAQLTHLARTVGETGDVAQQRARLQGISQEIARVRSRDLPALAGLVFPIDLDRGIAAGIRALAGQLPPYIATTLDVDEAGELIDRDVRTPTELVMLARVVEIGLAHAQRHFRVRNLTLTLHYDEATRRVQLNIEDNGVPNRDVISKDSVAYAELQAQIYNGNVEVTALENGAGSRLFAEFELPCDEM